MSLSIRHFFKPTDRRPTAEWALDNVTLDGTTLTKKGPFDISSSRHLIGPLSDLDDDHCREVSVLAPVRSGKTLCVDVWLPSVIARTPGPFMWVFQEDKAAKDQAELRTWPIIERCGPVAAMLPDNRFKSRAQEIIFPHMPVHIKGPAMSNLQSRGWQYVVLDEPWMYKAGRIEEARGRLGDFVRMGTDKFVCISQAGIDGDDWDRHYRRGVIHDWNVECQKCRQFFAPRWTGTRPDGTRWGMAWDKHKLESGLWDIPKVLPTVRFECQHCGFPHLGTTRTKSEWNRTGKYAAEQTEKSNRRRSRHWNAIVDYPWDELVELYLTAVNAWKMGVAEPLIQFFQKRMAEPKSERLLLEEGQKFSGATYEIKSDWPDEFTRVLTADRQAEDVYWVAVRSWAKDGRSRRLWFGKCYSGAEIEVKRDEFKVQPNLTFIDSGYKPKGDHGVYADCIRYGWVPTKGVATEGGEPVMFKHRMNNGAIVERSYAEPVWVDPEIGTANESRGTQVQMIRFSSPTYADRVENLIDRGLWQEPEVDESDGMDVEYRKQMAAEFRRPKRDKFSGKVKTVWVCPSGNNHARDCAKMQALAATLLDILPDIDAAEVKAG